MASFDLEIYKTVIFLVALFGRETWLLTLRNEHSLMVFQKRIEENICA